MNRVHILALIGLLAALASSCSEEPTEVPGPATDISSSDSGVRQRDTAEDTSATSDGTGTGVDIEDEANTDVSDIEEEVVPTPETECSNEIDDDGDQLVDCADPDCGCEVCNDTVDNDGDDLVDCLDPDCSDNEVCPEFCGNSRDDDADNLFDCDDSECSLTPRCAEEPTPYNVYEYSDTWSYLNRLQFPPEGVPCCFDFDGDEQPDNNLGLILPLIPNYSPQAGMDLYVNQGSVTVLLEWIDLPDELPSSDTFGFNVFRGFPVDPEPPFQATPDPDANYWRDGMGTFEILGDSFDGRGPRVRFRGVTATESDDADALISAGPDELNVTIPIAELGLELDLLLEEAQIELLTNVDTESEPWELSTAPDFYPGEDEDIPLGGGRIGGYVRAQNLVSFFNDAAELCACALPDGAPSPVIESGERQLANGNVRFEVECAVTPYSPSNQRYTCAQGSNPFCPQLSTLCAVLPLVPSFLDVDTNKNGAGDAISVGLLFEAVGATIQEPSED
ncbi:MAG: hypothetical protein KC561_03795 [Myxococcales bacterium]|nr:hypothetical protein [Myxococcales bacterium]